MHKLSPPWESPFTISRVLGNDSYYLVDVREDDQAQPQEREIERPWNVNLLRRLYTYDTMYSPMTNKMVFPPNFAITSIFSPTRLNLPSRHHEYDDMLCDSGTRKIFRCFH